MIRKSCILFVLLALGCVLCLTSGCADEWSENIIGTASTTPPAQMYWTIAHPPGASAIQRANLDGSQVEDLVTTGLSLPGGIAVNLAGGKMYWTDWGLNTIHRVNLDGSNVETLVTGLNTPPWGIAVDTEGGKMYWTIGAIGGIDGEIQRADVDGTNVETLVTGLYWPRYITLDAAGGKMYWTIAELGASVIQRANLDGSQVEDLVTTGLSLPGVSPWTRQAAKCTG